MLFVDFIDSIYRVLYKTLLNAFIISVLNVEPINYKFLTYFVPRLISLITLNYVSLCPKFKNSMRKIQKQTKK